MKNKHSLLTTGVNVALLSALAGAPSIAGAQARPQLIDPALSVRTAVGGLTTPIGIAFLAAIAAGLLNGFLVGRMRLNPIVATLGTNALLFGAVLWYSA